VTSNAENFEAKDFVTADPQRRDAWLGRLSRRLNTGFYAIVRGVIEADADETLALQREARELMKAPTHAYPWSVDGARVLLRALGPGLGTSYTNLFAATERGRELFAAAAWACLTRAERAKVAAGHVAGAAHAVIQTHESWQVHHGMHNDSRRGGAQMPLIASFLLAEGPSAGRLRLWPSGEPTASAVRMNVGDLCLQRDCMELDAGKMLYPLTHGTEPASAPEGAERIVAILRFGIVPEATLQAASAAGADPMDLYLTALTRG
jgi:hypothetical protein